MCFRKKLVLRFVFILFFLIPNICIASLLADNVSGMTHYDTHNLFLFAHNLSKTYMVTLKQPTTFAYLIIYNGYFYVQKQQIILSKLIKSFYILSFYCIIFYYRILEQYQPFCIDKHFQ